MKIKKVIIDTDILSAILKNNPIVDKEASKYLKQYKQLTFSLITKFEILRGLKSIKASSQIKSFGLFCSVSEIIPISDIIIEVASNIYADLHQKGQLIGDADILIAATAMVNGLVVITNNESHFNRISGIIIENWLK
jgi:tRNA(fMet)-specific endonuclease VapC